MVKKCILPYFKAKDPGDSKLMETFVSQVLALLQALYMDHISVLAENLYVKVFNDGSTNLSPP